MINKKWSNVKIITIPRESIGFWMLQSMQPLQTSIHEARKGGNEREKHAIVS